ncbi:MAG: hypothetical protein AABY15_06500 [Nanoarchaeota archaeon]
MNKKELVKFAQQLCNDIKKPMPNVAGAPNLRVDINNLEQYVDNYLKHKSLSYINKMNKLLDEFEEITGPPVFSRKEEFNRWKGNEEYLKQHIQKLKFERSKKLLNSKMESKNSY